MPELKNVKHEMFARNLVMGMNQKQAYIAAGFDGGKGTANSTAVSKRPDVKARISELITERTQQQVAGTHLENRVVIPGEDQDDDIDVDAIDRDWLIRRLVKVADESRIGRQFAAANKAYALIGELKGLFMDADTMKKTRDEKEEEKKKIQAENAMVPISALNKLLKARGFKGAPIDLAELTKVDAPKLSAEDSSPITHDSDHTG